MVDGDVVELCVCLNCAVYIHDHTVSDPKTQWSVIYHSFSQKIYYLCIFHCILGQLVVVMAIKFLL